MFSVIEAVLFVIKFYSNSVRSLPKIFMFQQSYQTLQSHRRGRTEVRWHPGGKKKVWRPLGANVRVCIVLSNVFTPTRKALEFKHASQ